MAVSRTRHSLAQGYLELMTTGHKKRAALNAGHSSRFDFDLPPSYSVCMKSWIVADAEHLGGSLRVRGTRHFRRFDPRVLGRQHDHSTNRGSLSKPY